MRLGEEMLFVLSWFVASLVVQLFDQAIELSADGVEKSVGADQYKHDGNRVHGGSFPSKFDS